MVSANIAKTVKNVYLEMKAHFFDFKHAISILEFLQTLKIARDTNRIQEEAARWIL